MATDGTPLANVIMMNKTFRLVRRLEKMATNKGAAWKSTISQQSAQPQTDLGFELVSLSPCGYGIREKKTGHEGN